MANSGIKSFEKAFDKRLERDFTKNLKRNTSRLSQEEFKERIKNFLEENCICTLATCSDNIPRATILRYHSRDLTIYFQTEGGGKMYNIKENPQVSISVCGEYTGFTSVKGLQIWGKAEIIKPTDPRYAEGLAVMNLGARGDLKEAGLDQNIPKMFLLKIDIERAKFLSFPDGIINQSITLK